MTKNELSEVEFNPYYKHYIGLVAEVPLIEALNEGMIAIPEFFKSIPADKLHYRYAEGKWTPKDILLHIIDTERVFSYRALCFARDNAADLPGFDENMFAENADANNRELEDLLSEYATVRNATVALFKSFNDTVLKKMGKGNNNLMSVRAAGFIICGHEIHHCNIIKERYLV